MRDARSTAEYQCTAHTRTELSFQPNFTDRILSDVRLQMSLVKQDIISTGSQTAPAM